MNKAELLSPDAKADIQGFITSGFGHLPYTAYLFVEIREREAGQVWLQSLLPHVTSAASWRSAPDKFKTKPKRALNVAFTFAGLAALGLAQATASHIGWILNLARPPTYGARARKP